MPTQVAIIRKNYPRQIRTYTFLAIIILAAAGFYGYLQYQKLSAAREALAREQEQTASMQSSVNKFSQDYTDLKSAFDKNFAAVVNSIQGVYPTEEDYTELTRLLDKFFQDNNTSLNPVFASDLKFSKPLMAKDKDYAVLPFTMTISATRSNFEKFLKFIESSGALEDRTRLMDIRSISINFAGQQPSAFTVAPGTAQIPLLNVSVTMNAYFQKPVEVNDQTSK